MKGKSFAILGLGKFGKSVAEELSRAGADVLVIDKDEEKVHEMAHKVTCAMKADVCDAEMVQTLGLSNMDAVVIAITQSLDASVLATILAKEAGAPYVIAKTKDELQSKILERVGADRVLIPEWESGIRVARNLVSGNFKDFIELSDRLRMIEIAVKEEWVGKNLIQLNFRKKYGANVVAMRVGQEMRINLNPEEALEDGNTLLLIVDRKDVFKLT